MSLSPLLLVHICSAIISLLSGVLSAVFRKGSGLHRVAGNIFFGAMLSMSSSAAYIATFMKPNMLNATVGLLTFYLVSTGWWAARRRDGGTNLFDVGAFLFVLLVGMAAMTFGLQAAGSPTGTKNGMPAGLYFFFGSMALLCAVSDVRMFVRGGVAGAHRIARHLWRMSFALLIALLSFFPGQAKLIPTWLRETNVLLVPHLLVIGSMLFWRFRVMRRKRAQPDKAIRARHADVSITRPVSA